MTEETARALAAFLSRLFEETALAPGHVYQYELKFSLSAAGSMGVLDRASVCTANLLESLSDRNH